MFHHFVEKRKTEDTSKTLPVCMLLNTKWAKLLIWISYISTGFFIFLSGSCAEFDFLHRMAKLCSGKTLEVSASLRTSLWSWSERFGSVPQKLHKALLVRVSGWYRWLDLFSVKNSQGMLSLNYLLSISGVNKRKNSIILTTVSASSGWGL